MFDFEGVQVFLKLPLGKTKRRWIVERPFAWYQKFRRLVVRYETTSSMYLACVHLACLMITLEQF
jgi:transposase